MSKPQKDNQDASPKTGKNTDQETGATEADIESVLESELENDSITGAEAAVAEDGDPLTAEALADVFDLEGPKVAELEAQVSELKDQLLRALAETENLRKRAQREREDALKYGATSFARDLLGVADNLARAIESVSPEDCEDERIANLLSGIELTQKELQSAFNRHHIETLDPIGEKLDPHRHEAMFEIPDPTQPNGTVVQVIQSGYVMHDRLLRPARVGVAKTSPQAAEAPADSDAEG